MGRQGLDSGPHQRGNDITQGGMQYLDFQASQEGLALRGFQLGHGAGQQAGEDGPKVPVHLHPAGVQSFPLLLVQLPNHLCQNQNQSSDWLKRHQTIH